MSSWKKASKTGQKFHKERGQVKDRQFLGLLEKKKDYKLRALDFQKKRDALINIKRKILEKNPDEFYFNMVNTEVKDGLHQLKKKIVEYTDEEIKLMKTQDKNYIRLHQQMENKKIEKLKSSLHLIDVENVPKNEHRFFVDDQDEGKSFDPVKQFNTHESLLNRKSNRLTLNQLENMKLPDWVDDEYLKSIEKGRVKKYKELNTRVKRETTLKKLEDAYDLKTPTTNPEDEYDEKYKTNYKSNDNSDDTNKNAKTYQKVVSRKR